MGQLVYRWFWGPLCDQGRDPVLRSAGSRMRIRVRRLGATSVSLIRVRGLGVILENTSRVRRLGAPSASLIRVRRLGIFPPSLDQSSRIGNIHPKCGSGFEDWEYSTAMRIRVRGLGIIPPRWDQGSRIGNIHPKCGSGFEDWAYDGRQNPFRGLRLSFSDRLFSCSSK